MGWSLFEGSTPSSLSVTLHLMPRRGVDIGSSVAFRRSSGALAYGTVEQIHDDGTVTVTFCEKTLYKTIPIEEISTSMFGMFGRGERGGDFVASARTPARRARRSTGRKPKKVRRVMKKR